MALPGLRKAAAKAPNRLARPAVGRDAPLPLGVCLLIWAAMALGAWALVALAIQLA